MTLKVKEKQVVMMCPQTVRVTANIAVIYVITGSLFVALNFLK